jgi:hypothetical protein
VKNSREIKVIRLNDEIRIECKNNCFEWLYIESIEGGLVYYWEVLNLMIMFYEHQYDIELYLWNDSSKLI